MALPVHETLSLLKQRDGGKPSSIDPSGLDIESTELPSNHAIEINSAKKERLRVSMKRVLDGAVPTTLMSESKGKSARRLPDDSSAPMRLVRSGTGCDLDQAV